MSARLPTYFLSHGGGPWPYMMDDPWARATYANMQAALEAIPPTLGERPKAVLVVSGHWEEPELTVSTASAPGMVYDYYGFPEHTYRIVYPAPGDPALAERVCAALAPAGHAVDTDAVRGFDHGAFSVLKPMFPDADVPVVQLSLKRSLDPEEHLAVGRALAPLRDEGVLVIGSGMSYHNLRLLGPGGSEPAEAFDEWLQRTLVDSAPEERRRGLVGWEDAPAARVAHPREEHLVPLMVAVGAADDEPAACIYREVFMGTVRVSSYRFGAAPAGG